MNSRNKVNGLVLMVGIGGLVAGAFLAGTTNVKHAETQVSTPPAGQTSTAKTTATSQPDNGNTTQGNENNGTTDNGSSNSGNSNGGGTTVVVVSPSEGSSQGSSNSGSGNGSSEQPSGNSGTENPPAPPVTPTPEPPAPPAPQPEPEGPAVLNIPPSVTKIAPTDDATGVAINAKVVVTFSEAMDRADAQAAFQISHGNPGTFSWSADDKVMTFTPGAPFAHGTNVTVKIAKTATDAAGASMVSAYESNFKVLRQTTVTLYSQPSFDGTVYAPPVAIWGDKAPTDQDTIFAGTWQRGFISFNLAGLPDDLVEIQSADVSVYQSAHHPDAYGPQTGGLKVQSIVFGSLDVSDFSRAANQFCWPGCVNLETPISNSAVNGWKSANVVSFVRADWNLRAERSDRAQFRLKFDVENAGAGPLVTATFASGDAPSNKPKLTITYTHP